MPPPDPTGLIGIRNLRDLGGLATTDGRRVAPRRLFRSGMPHAISDDDRRRLEDLGITTVIDLRSQWEQSRHPTDWDSVRIVSAPLVEEGRVATITRRFEAGELPSHEVEDWWTLTGVYQAPEKHAGSLRLILDTLTDAAGDDGFLIHCRGGKDRTSLAVLVILEALGVTRDEIVADFMLSNALVEAQDPSVMLREAGVELGVRARTAISGVKREWLDKLIEGIEQRHGSIARYVTDHLGVGPEQLERLRSEYLVPAV